MDIVVFEPNQIGSDIGAGYPERPLGKKDAKKETNKITTTLLIVGILIFSLKYW